MSRYASLILCVGEGTIVVLEQRCPVHRFSWPFVDWQPARGGIGARFSIFFDPGPDGDLGRCLLEQIFRP